MYDAEERMKEIMEAPQLSVVEKIKLYSDQLNRFLIVKNKMDVPAQAPVQRTSLGSPTPLSAEIPPQVPPTPVPAVIPSPVPATPKPNLCRKFRLNTASRNIYFEFFKVSGFTRTRLYYVILGQ
jgi:hypothetical protein